MKTSDLLDPRPLNTPASSKKNRPKKLRNMEAELDMFATDGKNEEEQFRGVFDGVTVKFVTEHVHKKCGLDSQL